MKKKKKISLVYRKSKSFILLNYWITFWKIIFYLEVLNDIFKEYYLKLVFFWIQIKNLRSVKKLFFVYREKLLFRYAKDIKIQYMIKKVSSSRKRSFLKNVLYLYLIFYLKIMLFLEKFHPLFKTMKK